MIHPFNEPDALVYHYTSAKVALDHVLPERQLRLSAFESTNDPKESKDWHFSLWSSRHRTENYDEGRQIGEWLSAFLRKKTTLACFCTDHPPLIGDHLRDILRRGYCRPRMWAQYADNHRGVCLIFRKEALMKNIQEQCGASLVFAGKVLYCDRAVVPPLSPHEFMINWDLYDALGATEYARRHLMQYHRQLFFEKLQDWRDEREWRVVVLGSSVGPVYVKFDGALVGVMHGAHIDERVSWMLTEATESSVEHMGLKWGNGVPWYDYQAGRWTSTWRRANAARRPT